MFLTGAEPVNERCQAFPHIYFSGVPSLLFAKHRAEDCL